MSYANGTQFYNLPQTVGSDKRDWFDSNAAFAAIDAALHAAVTGQAADAEAISTINGKLADDEANIAALQTKGNTHDSQIAALQTSINTQASQIQDVRQDAEDMITANNEGAAATSTRAYAIGDYFIYNDVLYKATAAIAIGDTIVPNTNCEATNVDTEITQLNNDLGKIIDGSAFLLKTVQGSDSKTISDCLNEFYSTLTGLNYETKKNLTLRIVAPSQIVYAHINKQLLTAGEYEFNSIAVTMPTTSGSGGVQVRSYQVMTNSASKYGLVSVALSASTPSWTSADYSSNTTEGMSFQLFE